MTILTRNTDILRAEVAAHLTADALVKGTYWEAGENSVRGTGCFIGCLTHSKSPEPAYVRFGLPVALLRIAENIFEALPDHEGKAFFAALPDAVDRDGRDLSRVVWAFLAAEFRALPKTTDAVQAVIHPVISGMDILANGQDWTDAADAAAYTAYAADAAAYTAQATAYAAQATADAAAYAAYAAACATADAAARAAAYAAYAAAYTADAAARLRQRDTLLALISVA